MKLVTYATGDGAIRAGIHTGAAILDLSGLGFPDAKAFVAAGPSALAAVEQALAGKPTLVPADQVKLLAPILNPPRLFAIGLNYREHAAESKKAIQAVPTVFLKLNGAITGDGAPIVLPTLSASPDYEAELAVVIGKGGYEIRADDWQSHVFGYTIVNDVTARDVQSSTTQWTLGKSFPSFAPMGPWIVTADEVADPHALSVKLSISGETLQDGNTSDLVFRIPALIEYISSITPLEPGDIISTGTPKGVGMGRDPQRWLQPNEEVVVEIESIGTLRNPTVAQVR